MKRWQKTINTHFWTSPHTEAFSSTDRFLYLYLTTNPHTNFCGCYEISRRLISHETGMRMPDVREGMRRLEQLHGTILYDEPTRTVLVTNGMRNSYTSSPKMEKRLRKEISQIKNYGFQLYLRSELQRLHNESVRAKQAGMRSAFRLPPFEP